jgi:hypothetical protein
LLGVELEVGFSDRTLTSRKRRFRLLRREAKVEPFEES